MKYWSKAIKGLKNAGKSPYFSYLIDWFVVVMLFAIGVPMEAFIKPVERTIFKDISISYPHVAKEVISGHLIPVLGLAVPIFILFVVLRVFMKASWHKIHVTILALCLAQGFALVFTTTIKSNVGRLRPDFLQRCMPDPNILDRVVCTGNPSLIREGRKSFPSGHSTQISLAMFYLCFFFLGNLAFPKMHGGRSLKLLCIAIPIYVSIYISMTRVSDYRHHWEDVVFGMFTGLTFSYAAYRLYYPSPLSARSHILTTTATHEEQKDRPICRVDLENGAVDTTNRQSCFQASTSASLPAYHSNHTTVSSLFPSLPSSSSPPPLPSTSF